MSKEINGFIIWIRSFLDDIYAEKGSSGTDLELNLIPKSQNPNGVVCISGGNVNYDLDKVYPIGSIYMSVNSTNPSTLFGGSWEQIAQGRTIIGQGTGTDSNSVSKTFTNGTTGGEYNHTLTTSEMPKHKHQTGSRQTYGSGSAWGLINYGSSVSTQDRDTSETGSGNAHNNIQPYFVCYIWKRTA